MGKKILIVDDEFLIAEQLKSILSLMGHDVCDTAATGPEAVEIAKREKPDIALIDVRLVGEMDGIDTAEAILSFRKIPIMFMSGYTEGDREAESRMKAMDPVACFNKPLKASDICSVIDSVFSAGK